ncbi:hypothetical protein [Tateyamaria pelophila]|uniref:hypothetical protein n=1 Tax=Tateyamaria pelophila TaxID=328415 RepID=UPI001CBFD214|nr:hypothetical protein [Tateyamaria pelophila]
MKTYLAALPALLIATPGFAHHEGSGFGPSGLLHSPISIMALTVALVLTTALAARRLRAVSVRDEG